MHDYRNLRNLSNEELLAGLMASVDEERRAAAALLVALAAVEDAGIPLETALAEEVAAVLEDHEEFLQSKSDRGDPGL
jgi:hypothetical protein